ncbi:SURF1 family protein [Achromobacter sp. MFA1 R4]|uniref:SURF1 family protein n=1 Tax=Achromobacter sp. MFA1 R4 TaxID=1881016 RepID=UPI000953961A|nr:SURF1 family protein [Achromobacter sp. MFA1 R4]SIT09636.1 surfeit locus 1 family protein [Achromobacter sp. MFA1 R4]
MAAVKDISSRDTSRNPRSKATLVILGLLAAAVFAGLCALGTWQVHRLAWKRALIAQVDERAHAPATPAPGKSEWAQLTRDNAEYRPVSASGTFNFDQQTLVQAATELGSGYWVMTPLQLADGSTVLVNRGFVLPAWRKSQAQTAQPPAQAQVTGFLRMGEPGSGFLRNNDPDANLWYSRDLPAIAAARGLTDVAPYFIDADAASSPGKDPARAPVGGLTVISFPNNHLVYAITWYALALMVIVGVVVFVREERRARRP